MNPSPQHNGLTDFALSVLSHVVAEIVVIIILAIVAFFSRSKIRELIRAIRFVWRMHRNGIIDFYNSRQEYGQLCT
jgi:hypothetical protein